MRGDASPTGRDTPVAVEPADGEGSSAPPETLLSPPAAAPGRLGRLRARAAPGSFTRHVLTVMTGTTVGQALTVLSAPLLTRLYGPEEFGLFGIYLAIATTASVAVCGKYESAILLPQRDGEAVNLLGLSLLIAAALTVAGLGVALALYEPVATRLGVEVGSDWYWMVPLSFFPMGVFFALNAWASRRAAYREVARSRVLQSASGIAIQLAAGAAGLGARGLMGGYLLGHLVGSVGLVRGLMRRDLPLFREALSRPEMRRMAEEHRSFPTYMMPVGVLNSVSQQVPNLLLPVFFGPAVVGQYVLSYRVFSLPLSTVSRAFMQVFYQRAASRHANGGELHSMVVRSYRDLLLLAAAPALLLMLIGPSLFSFVFGAEWDVAGAYLRLLIPFLVLRFAASPSTCVFAVLGKQNVQFQYENGILAVRLAALLTGALVFRSAMYTIGLYGLAGVFINLFYMSRVLRLTRGDALLKRASAPMES